MNITKNAAFAFSTATKLSVVALLVGLVLTHFNSPVFLGIVFISATFLMYTKVAGLIVFLVSLVTSAVSKSKADKEVALKPYDPNFSFNNRRKAAGNTATAEETLSARMADAATAFSHLTEEEKTILLQEMMARKRQEQKESQK